MARVALLGPPVACFYVDCGRIYEFLLLETKTITVHLPAIILEDGQEKFLVAVFWRSHILGKRREPESAVLQRFNGTVLRDIPQLFDHKPETGLATYH